MSRSTHAKWLNGREKREGYEKILVVKWHQIGGSLSEIYEKSVKSNSRSRSDCTYVLADLALHFSIMRNHGCRTKAKS